MIVIEPHGMPGEFIRKAHACRISASDMRNALAGRETKAHRQLIDRLVLDFEGVQNHTDEFPDPWHDEHDAAVAGALRLYKLSAEADVEQIGFVIDEDFSWLACSPHALVGHNGCVHVRWRRTLRNLKEAGRPDRYELARLHVVMRVCDREWCDLVDFWDGGDVTLDQLRVQRVPFDRVFFTDTVLARLVIVWQTVAQRRAERRAAG